jgi:hypothetical protein
MGFFRETRAIPDGFKGFFDKILTFLGQMAIIAHEIHQKNQNVPVLSRRKLAFSVFWSTFAWNHVPKSDGNVGRT